jgi:hypothetical protein
MNIDGLTPHELRDGIIADHTFPIGKKIFRLAGDSRSSQMITALIRLGSQPSCKVETPPGKGRQLSMRMAGLL